jgi:hypothetical protein
VLEHHAGVLQRAVEEYRSWIKTSTDAGQTAYSTVDEMGNDRVERLIAQAVYDIWEGTVLDVRLEGAHDPWIVSLVNQSCDLVEGGRQLHVNANAVSWEGAAFALLGAITIAVPQLQRSLAENTPGTL